MRDDGGTYEIGRLAASKPDLYRLAALGLSDLCQAGGEGILKAGMASGS